MATSNQAQSDVGNRGLLINRLSLSSQSAVLNESLVLVEGILRNISNSIHIDGHVDDGWIDGFKFSDDGGFNYDLDPGDQKTFTSHTFTCPHGDRGDLTVNFSVNFSHSGDPAIGNNQSQFCQLVLPSIDVPSTRPQNPVSSNQTSTSVRLSWDVPHDNGGRAIVGYTIERYNGTGTTGKPIKYGLSSSTARNMTDLEPGQTYTYLIYAHNNTQFNNGVSDSSVPLTVLANTGVFVRVGGHWKTAAPYVRVAGKWQLATSFVRTANNPDPALSGTWTPTNS